MWELEGDASITWENVGKKVEMVAKAILGESKDFGPRDKETWWWNEEVQEKVRNKKNCFKAIHLDNSSDNWEKYRLAKREAKKAVSDARAKAYEGFYKELGTKAGEQRIYKIARNKEESRDLDQVRCIKNEVGKVLVTEGDIKNRWEEYFYKLFNDGCEGSRYDLEDLTVSECELNRSFYRRIRVSEVSEALKKMENGKAVGPDGIPIEV